MLDTPVGNVIRIIAMPSDWIGAYMLRMGIEVGTEVRCIQKVLAGPVVLDAGGVVVAVGRDLARQIRVQ